MWRSSTQLIWGLNVKVMEKSCGAACSIIREMTRLMECGIHMSPTQPGERHADRWEGEVLVGEI